MKEAEKGYLFSIIVPVYKVELYIDRCAESILNQSFTNYEVVFVDDGSPDHSVDILNEFLSEYAEKTASWSHHPEVKILHQSNRGLSAARNTGIKASSGRYIWFVDSDDAIVPECLAVLAEHLNQTAQEGKNLDLLFFEERQVSNEGLQNSSQQSPQVFRTLSPDIMSGKDLFIEMRERKCYQASACGYLIRREFLLRENIFFYPGILHEDELFTPMAMYYAAKVQYLQYAPYIRYIREGSITRTTSGKGIMSSFLGEAEVIRQLYTFYNARSLNQESKSAYTIAFVDNLRGLIAESLGMASCLMRTPEIVSEEKGIIRIKKKLHIDMGFWFYIYLAKNRILNRTWLKRFWESTR